MFDLSAIDLQDAKTGTEIVSTDVPTHFTEEELMTTHFLCNAEAPPLVCCPKHEGIVQTCDRLTHGPDTMHEAKSLHKHKRGHQSPVYRWRVDMRLVNA